MAKKITTERPFRRVAGIIPEKTVKFFEKKLKFAGIREEPRVWLGKRFLFSFCIGALLHLVYLIIYNPIATYETFFISVGLLTVGFSLTALLFYLGLYFRISDRTSHVEKILPDFLLLIVSNLRAGMPPFGAFVHAARPQFGALYQEVKLSAAKASGAASLVDTLNEIGNYFDSKILHRTVGLFAKGTRSGGQLAKLLIQSADEVRRIHDLRAELVSSTRTYTIFLGFILVIVMPFLLSVSTLFVTIFLELQPETTVSGVEEIGNIPTFSGKIQITPDQMITIAIGTLLVTSLFVSGLAGIISKGKTLYGVKYFPFFAVASIIVYFLVKAVMSNMFSVFALS